jgi:hypothetical protein
MLTLHTLSEEVKTVLKWIGGFLGVILLVYLIFNGGVFVKHTFFPTPPPPPTVSFGKLPKIVFPQSVTDTRFAYTVDTLSGSLPGFPDRATVVKTITKESSLFDLNRARDKVKAVGFSFEGYIIASESALSPTLYEWNDNGDLAKRITMNIVTNNFRLTSAYLTNYSVLNPPSFPSEADAAKRVTQTLESMSLTPSDLDATKTRTELLQISNNTLIPATSISSANIIRVDLFQKDLNNAPLVYAHPPYSTMNFLVSGTDYLGDIVQGTFIHQDIGTDTATYPIKTITQAFDDLQKGKAYVARYYGTDKSVPVQKIYLAYFVSEENQVYVQPIFVFEGKDGFVAYVTAIDSSWYE